MIVSLERPLRALSVRAPRLLRIGIVFVSLFLFAIFLYAAARRLFYPFDLEWVEGGILQSVYRVAHGEALYAAPSLKFVPYLYAPVYFYVAAGLSRVTGINFTTLRLVSIVSTVGSAILIGAIVVRESRKRSGGLLAAVAAAGLFIGCYALVDNFFDLGRVDMLSLFLLLLALYCTRHHHPVIAAIIWVLAFQTKQTIVVIAILALCADWERPRRVLIGVAAFVALLAGSVLVLNEATHGWYNFYVFRSISGLSFLPRQAALFLPQELLAPFGIAFVIIATALLIAPLSAFSRASFYLVCSFALYLSVWFTYSHVGSSSNALIPAYAWTAILFGVALVRLLEVEVGAVSRVAALNTVLLAGALIQLSSLIYNPGGLIPHPDVVIARRNFIEQIRKIPGPVFVPEHPWDAVLAGKPSYATVLALGLILDSRSGKIGQSLREQVWHALDDHRFGAVVLDGDRQSYHPGRNWVPPDFYSQYPLAISAIHEHERFLTSQPEWIYLPCGADIRSLITPETLSPVQSACTAPTAPGE